MPIKPGTEGLGMKMVECRKTIRNRATCYDLTLEEPLTYDRTITLYWATDPVCAERLTWLEGVYRSKKIEKGKAFLSKNGDSHIQAFNFPGLGACPNALSRYPFGAISDGKKGYGIGIDMSSPSVFRIGFKNNRFYIAFDLGFAAGMNRARVKFCTFEFDPEWGFRGALERYYEIFPESFASKLPKKDQGIWMPINPIETVQGWKDFGFKFHETSHREAGSAKRGDEMGVLSFHYIEPITYWMGMDVPKGSKEKKLKAIWEEAERRKAMDPRIGRIDTSIMHFADYKPCYIPVDMPWCRGALFGMNSMPGIKGRYTDFNVKWSDKDREILFANSKEDGIWDGVYIDSAEGWMVEHDFRREHFKSVQTPLTFSRNGKVSIFIGMIDFEFIRAISRDVRAKGKFMMCNQCPVQICFLAPLFDILGSETHWMRDRKWSPMPIEDMFFRRALCRQKPYCLLQNTQFEVFTHAHMEKYMKRSVAMGFSPSCFSHNAADQRYFTRPECYNRDRDLFKKYIPICNELSVAGWEPIPNARASDRSIHLERFGENYLTVFNDSSESRSFSITLTARKEARAVDLLTGKEFFWRKGSADFCLPGEDALYLKFR